MKKIFLGILAIMFYTAVNAQPTKGQFINASIGLGMSASNHNSDMIIGNGFYAQGEYVWGITKWFGLRPYAGVIFTSSNKTEMQKLYNAEYNVSTHAFLLGGKCRVVAPIPYVAPYLETGIGVSLGSFQTYTPSENVNKSGIVTHIPFSLGLALGKKHRLDFAFTYYFHPSAAQFAGAAALGFSFPLE